MVPAQSNKAARRSGSRAPCFPTKILTVARLFLFLTEHGTEAGFGVFITLADLKLAEDSVPSNINFMP
jgi:hypothetical protein